MANQIKKKFIGSNQIDGTKILMNNNEAIRARNAADTADFELIKLTLDDYVQVSGLKDPTGDRDAAHKDYVDQAVAGGGQALADHLNDTVDAHDASAISFVPAGNIAATEVQAAIEELDGDKVAKSGDTMSGTLNMNSNSITGLPSPTANGQPLVYDQLGAASGVAPLNASSKIDALYLPSYVDDVLEYANLAAFPGTGESEKIYVALDTNKTYRWSGSTYIEISPSEVNSVNTKTGIVTLYTDDISEDGSPVNLWFTDTRARAAAVADSITDGVTNIAPSQNAVFDAFAAVDGRLDVLEAIEWATPFKKTLTNTDISNGYINLPHQAVETNGMSAYVDRLAIHQGEDYTLSVVGGVTRITFAGDLVSPGNQQLQNGDSIYVRYQRSV